MLARCRMAVPLGLLMFLALTLPVYSEVALQTTSFSSDITGLYYLPNSANVLSLTGDRRLWVSHDDGRTWNEVIAARGLAAQVFIHPTDGQRVYVLSNGKTHWSSIDGGATFSAFTTPSRPSLTWTALQMNTALLSYLIYHGQNCEDYSGDVPFFCYVTNAYFSKDNGVTWKKLKTDVSHCEFGSNGRFKGATAKTMFCGQNLETDDYYKVSYLLRSDDEFASQRLLFRRYYYDHLLVDDFLVLVAPDDAGNSILWVSGDGEHFVQSIFSANLHLAQNEYFFLESHESSILMALESMNSKGRWAALVSSNSDGSYFTTLLDYMNYDYDTVDFEKFQSLEGVIFVNEVINWSANSGTKRVRTLISFNDGATWQRLPPPIDTDCADVECNLNLHGNTEHRMVGSVFSSSSAVGLGVGVGNPGSYLKPYSEGNTYLTNDGGQTWKMIRLGPHLHEFGDHGAIIVIVNDLDPTRHVRYSFDEGATWVQLQVTSGVDTIRATELTTEPSSESVVFLLHGRLYRNGSDTGVDQIISIDFTNLHTRVCDVTDFEQWQLVPFGTQQDRCVLGHEITYTRRKPTSQCLIGANAQTVTKTIDNCPCSLTDFECDFNFVPSKSSTGSLQCTRLNGTSDAPSNCTVGQHYAASSGYRRIPATTCVGGLTLDAKVDTVCTASIDPASKPPLAASNDVSSLESDFSFSSVTSIQYFANSTRAILLDSDGSVWLTKDEGANWFCVHQSNKTAGSIVASVVLHPYHSGCAFLLIPEGPSKFTYNFGDTFVVLFNNSLSIFARGYVDPISFTRDEAHSFIVLMQNCYGGCHAEAYLTRDMGRTYKIIAKYPRKCLFAAAADLHPLNPKTIMCEIDDSPVGAQSYYHPYSLYASNDEFATFRVMVSDVLGVFVFQKYIVTATYDHQNFDLILLTSLDGDSFDTVELDVTTKDGFTFLQSSSIHSLFLDVFTHPSTSPTAGGGWGTLLVSNSDGSDFSVSLEATNRQGGIIDFERVAGVEGVLIANHISNTDSVMEGLPKLVESLISFDDGRGWTRLSPPASSTAACVESCHLHVHTLVEGRANGNVFSSSSAPGLMIATGNVGDYLGDYSTSSMFMTTDAGVTWKLIREGPHLFEFGDRGAIAVLIPDDVETDTLFYSYDFGQTWLSYVFTVSKLRVTWLTTNPDSISRKFLIYGTTTSSVDKAAGIISRVIQVDFSGLHERKCVDSDFENWQLQQCVLGHQTTYNRRKADSACYIDDPTRIPIITAVINCLCTLADYECATGFSKKVFDGTCLPKDPATLAEPANCRSTYIVPPAYRLIPGDTCNNASTAFDKGVSKVCGSSDDPAPTEPSTEPYIYSQKNYFGATDMSAWYHSPYHTNAVMVLENGDVYLTQNEGLVWQPANLPDYSSSVLSIIATSIGSTILLITATSSHYVSYDFGVSFSPYTTPLRPNPAIPYITLHDTSTGTAFVIGFANSCRSACKNLLYYTTDKGTTWTQIKDLSNAIKCVWLKPLGVGTTDLGAVCQIANSDGSISVALVENWISRTIMPASQNLFYAAGFVAITVPQASDATMSDVYIWGSDSSTFQKATFPSSAVIGAKYNALVPSPRQSIFIDVNPVPGLDGFNGMGTIYTSSSRGSAFSFTQSLPNVRRTRETEDVQQLPGIEGVLIANVVSNPTEYAQNNKDPVIKTVRTFDNGGQWNPIPAPPFDSLNKPTNCLIANDCSLHLHSRIEDGSIAAYTQSIGALGAVGMAMAIGNLGAALGDSTTADTYLTTDAGRSWTMIRKGPHLHAFLDTGALMVIVNSMDATNRVRYSWDYGVSWQVYYFLTGTDMMQVSMLHSFAEATAQEVMVVGTIVKTGGLTAITIDFSNLHSRVCDQSDFEQWRPSDETGSYCLLGHELQYMRRRPNSVCSVSEQYIKEPVIANCPCTKLDFECDIGFERSGSDCVPVSPNVRKEPAGCIAGTQYTVPSGYRKIPIDTCQSGSDLSIPITRICGQVYSDSIATQPTTSTPTQSAPTSSTSQSGSSSVSTTTSGGIGTGAIVMLILTPFIVGILVFAVWFVHRRYVNGDFSMPRIFRNVRYVPLQQEDVLLDDYL